MHDPLWRPIPGLSDADGRPLAFASEKTAKNGWAWRQIALPLRGGGAAWISPIRGLGAAGLEDLEASVGRLELLVAPNHFHHLGIPELLYLRPEAKVVAAAGAVPRLSRILGPSVEPAWGLLGPRLPAGVRWVEPPGLKNGEGWVVVEGSGGTGWIVSDAFFSLERAPTGIQGMLVRALGVAPGLRIGATFLWLGIADRPSYRAWLLERLDAEKPTILVTSHGQILQDPELWQRMAEVVRARV
ncbi:MAG: hypothetical protein U1E65_01435 [Myxococcota bacterium]